MIELTATAATDAGMFMLWQPEAFTSVEDYDTWAEELEEDEDVARHVRAGHCVPINIEADLASSILVRCASTEGPVPGAAGVPGVPGVPAELTARESRFVIVSSQPYLFVSHGLAQVDGIEAVGEPQSPRLPVPAGRWAVTVHLIDWEAEEGMAQPDGLPAEGALPDFVVLLNPATERTVFRQRLVTFDRPE